MVLIEISRVALVVKSLPANVGDVRQISGSRRSPGGGYGNPIQDSCLENHGILMGQRSLVGHSPWGRKESDTNEAT